MRTYNHVCLECDCGKPASHIIQIKLKKSEVDETLYCPNSETPKKLKMVGEAINGVLPHKQFKSMSADEKRESLRKRSMEDFKKNGKNYEQYAKDRKIIK